MQRTQILKQTKYKYTKLKLCTADLFDLTLKFEIIFQKLYTNLCQQTIHSVVLKHPVMLFTTVIKEGVSQK